MRDEFTKILAEVDSIIPDIIFEKVYTAESLLDLDEDIADCINNIPKDEHGFPIGEFRITIERMET